jgi:hypothetical protein
MAGESPDRMPYSDTEEEYVGETLRNIMQNKTARYGAYDFIGRVMGFTHLDNGKTVAAVTNDFMDQFEDREHEPFRQAFLRAFEKVMDWYAFPLSTPVQNWNFHGFIGTIQLVTTHHALEAIDAGLLSESQVRDAIARGWMTFAQNTLEMKQTQGHSGNGRRSGGSKSNPWPGAGPKRRGFDHAKPTGSDNLGWTAATTDSRGTSASIYLLVGSISRVTSTWSRVGRARSHLLPYCGGPA